MGNFFCTTRIYSRINRGEFLNLLNSDTTEMLENFLKITFPLSSSIFWNNNYHLKSKLKLNKKYVMYDFKNIFSKQWWSSIPKVQWNLRWMDTFWFLLKNHKRFRFWPEFARNWDKTKTFWLSILNNIILTLFLAWVSGKWNKFEYDFFLLSGL